MGATHRVSVDECRSDSRYAGKVWNVVEIALRIGSVVVNGRRNDRVPNREACRGDLKGGRGAHGVAYHRFDGTHGDIVGGGAEGAAKGARLYEVVVGQGVSVSVDVV